MRKYFRCAQAERVHEIFATPITLPTGTTPQTLVTLDLSSAIANLKTNYRANSVGAVRPLYTVSGKEILMVFAYFHFTRPSNQGSATVYWATQYSGTSSNTSVGANLSLTTCAICTITDDQASLELRASQSAAVGWTLMGYTVYLFYRGFVLGGSVAISDSLSLLHFRREHIRAFWVTRLMDGSDFFPPPTGASTNTLAMDLHSLGSSASNSFYASYALYPSLGSVSSSVVLVFAALPIRYAAGSTVGSSAAANQFWVYSTTRPSFYYEPVWPVP